MVKKVSGVFCGVILVGEVFCGVILVGGVFWRAGDFRGRLRSRHEKHENYHEKHEKKANTKTTEMRRKEVSGLLWA